MEIKYQSEINNKFRDDFDSEVKNAKSILITSHKSPDDDSISSVLGTYNYINIKFPNCIDKVKIIYTGEKDDKWNSIKNYDKVKYVDDVANHLSEFDLVIILDCQGWSRFVRTTNELNFAGRSILIDHHPKPLNQFDLQLIMSNYSSTAEIVYDLFYQDSKLDKDICETILLGILGDTGNLRYISNKNSNVLSVARRLIDEGEINVDAFSNRLQKITPESYEILIELMKNSKVTKIGNWPKVVYSSIDIKKCVEKRYTDNQISEGASLFTVYLRSISGVDWGMVITPRLYDKSHSVSFRSSPGSVITREIGEKMGIGGGHDRASGGKILTDSTKKQ